LAKETNLAFFKVYTTVLIVILIFLWLAVFTKTVIETISLALFTAPSLATPPPDPYVLPTITSEVQVDVLDELQGEKDVLDELQGEKDVLDELQGEKDVLDELQGDKDDPNELP
jgi:hypothetical protein